MKKFHVAISTDKIEETVTDYTARLGAPPCVVVPGQYALWRTDGLNLSVRQDPACAPGSLRHLGWEDPAATEFSKDADVNGIVWERFSAEDQAREIDDFWPGTEYRAEE